MCSLPNINLMENKVNENAQMLMQQNLGSSLCSLVGDGYGVRFPLPPHSERPRCKDRKMIACFLDSMWSSSSSGP
jgi:hypothetical protein